MSIVKHKYNQNSKNAWSPRRLVYNRFMERLINYFIPENYQLNLRIDRKTETLSGEAKILGKACADVIKFHAVDLMIQDVWYRLDDDNETMPAEYRYDGQILELPLEPALKDNKIEITVEYSTALNRNMEGCYLSIYEHDGHEERIATTQFESHYAREAFPCIDEPAAKATFDLDFEIPDYEDGDVVIANMPLISNDDGHFVFDTTPRMSTYLLAWTIGKFNAVRGSTKNGTEVATYGALNQNPTSLDFANEVAIRSLEYYDQKFGVDYPLPKLDQVALPDFEAGAMENWGLVTYRESMMLADPDASLDVKKSVAVTVTHELSHQWFGNLVTMAWWDDLWLNESFASVMEYYAADALYPDFKIWQDFFTGDCLAALKRDSIPGVQSVKQAVNDPAEIATLFDGAIVYAKGARLIYMLIREMGEDKFDQGIRDYFKKHQYSNTIGDNLWEALQPYASFDVKDFMHAWISQPGFPELKNHGKVQKRFMITGETDDSHWPLPEVMDDMSGHYLINLTDEEFAKKIADFANLTEAEKLRVLIDRMLLAKTTAVESASLLDLLPIFQTEENAAAWQIIGTIIADLKLFCDPDSDNARHYKAVLRQIFRKRFEQIDYGKLTDTEELARRALISGMAIYAEDEAVLQKYNSLYQKDVSKIDSEIRAQVLISAIKLREQEIFDELLTQYQQACNPEVRADILFVLGNHAKMPEHLATMIDLLSNPKIVRPQDHLHLYIYLLRNYYSREQALDWLLHNWDYVVKMTGEKTIADYVCCTGRILQTPTEAEKFYQFFDPMKDDPIIWRDLAMAHIEIDAKIQLIETDMPEVTTKLAELAKE